MTIMYLSLLPEEYNINVIFNNHHYTYTLSSTFKFFCVFILCLLWKFQLKYSSDPTLPFQGEQKQQTQQPVAVVYLKDQKENSFLGFSLLQKSAKSWLCLENSSPHWRL